MTESGKPKEVKIKLKGYKSNLGMFLQLHSNSFMSCSYLLIDKKPMNEYPEYKGYFLVPLNCSIEKILKKPALVKEYKLKDCYQELSLPKVIDASLVKREWDDEKELTVFTCSVSGVTSEMISVVYQEVLAEPTEEIVPVDVDFDVKEIYIENLDRPEETKVKLTETDHFKHKVQELDLSKCVYYHELEELLTPEFLMHKKPCVLPSKTFYNIVRNYIKSNYDPKHFRISSDYDFCFTVNKLVAVKPYQKEFTDYFARGKKSKKVLKTVDCKEVKVLNITNKVDNYKDHDCLPDLHGDSLKDMKERLEEFLSNLMTELKSEVQECEHCKGLGHIVKPVDLKVKL